jgi:haloalkane dehalogenase
MSAAEVIAAHRAAGRFVTAGGVSTFVRDEGEGAPVLCLHGVPASSLLYRKVLSALAARELRGIAYDLPGLGLSDRPQPFDYSWTGLGAHAAAVVDVLELERFHLVVHDVGGPVGFELAAAMPERIASLTILNTIIDVAEFRRPWSMEPFARRGIGRWYLRGMSKPIFRALMALQGIGDRGAVRGEELDAYVDLLKRDDGGRAFLQIMRGFERTDEKQRLYRSVVGDARYPRQIVWGDRDPALRLGVQGEQARLAAGLDAVHRVPGRHFLQEDCADAIATYVAALAAGADGAGAGSGVG